MMRLPRLAAVFCVLTLLLALGCQKRASEPRRKRPVAGDIVTPVILLGKTWKAKGPVLISARLQVKGRTDAKASLLQLEDIPYATVPKVTLTFFAGERPMKKLSDVALTRDC